MFIDDDKESFQCNTTHVCCFTAADADLGRFLCGPLLEEAEGAGGCGGAI